MGARLRALPCKGALWMNAAAQRGAVLRIPGDVILMAFRSHTQDSRPTATGNARKTQLSALVASHIWGYSCDDAGEVTWDTCIPQWVLLPLPTAPLQIQLLLCAWEGSR